MLATLTNAADTHKTMIDQVGYSKGRLKYYRFVKNQKKKIFLTLISFGKDPDEVGSILPYKASENDMDEMKIQVLKYISKIQVEIFEICDLLGIDKNSEPPCEDTTLIPQEKPQIIVNINEAKNLIPGNING